MEAQRLLLIAICLFYFVFSGEQGVQRVSAAHHPHHMHRSLSDLRLPTKLFVFGDSYSAIGNNDKFDISWKYPYGITFPGKPSGRFSDGHVLTDFIAEFLGVQSPMPYELRKFGAKEELKNGMNFAYGGTGVFDTYVKAPNMTTQIDNFQLLIKDNVFTTTDLHSSVALITLAGNDYTTYAATNGSHTGWIPYITGVVNQLAVNLNRISELGVKKILVATLEPMGCLPPNTAISSFKICNTTHNGLVQVHNTLLQKSVAKFNNQTKSSSLIVLDLYNSFMSVFKNKGDGKIRFENPLRPCCVGTSYEYLCGSMDDITGEAKYTLCDAPESTFFWDMAHPTQQGWRAVYSTLQPALQQLYN